MAPLEEETFYNSECVFTRHLHSSCSFPLFSQANALCSRTLSQAVVLEGRHREENLLVLPEVSYFRFHGGFFLCHQRCYCPTGHVIRPYIGSLLLVCSARARNSHSRGQKQTPSCHCIWRPAGTSTDAFLCPVRILPTTVSFLPFLSGSWWSYMGQGVHFHPSVNSVPRKTHKFRGALERDVVAPIQTSLKVQRFLLLG